MGHLLAPGGIGATAPLHKSLMVSKFAGTILPIDCSSYAFSEQIGW